MLLFAHPYASRNPGGKFDGTFLTFICIRWNPAIVHSKGAVGNEVAME